MNSKSWWCSINFSSIRSIYAVSCSLLFCSIIFAQSISFLSLFFGWASLESCKWIIVPWTIFKSSKILSSFASICLIWPSCSSDISCHLTLKTCGFVICF